MVSSHTSAQICPYSTIFKVFVGCHTSACPLVHFGASNTHKDDAVVDGDTQDWVEDVCMVNLFHQTQNKDDEIVNDDT